MTKKYFGISKPLMIEILKMYWYVPVFSFTLYFFTGIFPILINMRNLSDIGYYVEQMMSNCNLAYVGLLSCIPLVIAILMMTFLHDEAKSLTLHSQPISKGRLFDTRFLGGWILCILPIAANTIIYLCMCALKEIPYKYGFLNAGNVIAWFFSSVAIITFIYALYILAGTLTGTTLMHFLTSGVLFVIFPLIIGIFIVYCETFLPGWYETPEWMLDLICTINPIAKLLMICEAISLKEGLLYLFMGILLALAAKCIYFTRKLELIGTSILSKVFENLLTYMIVFIGTCLFGLLISSFSVSKWSILISTLIGTVFTFAIVKIVFNRSFKCFERTMLRPLVICYMIGIVFIAFTVFDIGGYAKKVPDIGDIESVEISEFMDGYGVNGYISGEVSSEYFDLEKALTGENSIELIRTLHEYIIDERLYMEPGWMEATVYSDVWEEDYSSYEYISIIYNLKDGSELKRRYGIYLDDKVEDLIDDILTCPEYVENMKLENSLRFNKIKSIEINSYVYEYSSDYYMEYENMELGTSKIIIADPKLIKGLIRAKDKDFSQYGYLSNNPKFSEIVAEMKIFFVTDGAEKGNESRTLADSNSSNGLASNSRADIIGEEENFLWVEIRENDSNTIDFLIENGYGSIIGY